MGVGDTAIYRRWRPQRFAEVVGQELVVRTLRRAVAQGKLSHAYLFAGQRGVGKTTVARILARAANCLSPEDGEPCNRCENCTRILSGKSLDMVEIDGASNRGIDQIRRLREEVNFIPAGSRYKIYIIDEVHMLTNEAFNALLKTLEEPPPHVIFILATTEPHKVPPTILSRCQVFEFTPIPEELIAGKLLEIAQAEGIGLEEGAARLIARRAGGSLRDAEVMLEQLAQLSQTGTIGEDEVVELLGLPPQEEIRGFLDALLRKDADAALGVVRGNLERGRDLGLFLEEAAHAAKERILAGEGELVEIARKLFLWRGELTRAFSPRLHLELEILAHCGAPTRKPQAPELVGEGIGAGNTPGSAASPGSVPPAPAGGDLPQSGSREAGAGDAPGEGGLFREGERPEEPRVPSLPSPEDLESPWDKLIATCLRERTSVAAFLLPAEADFRDGILTIRLPEGYGFHYEMLREPGTAAFVERLARRFFSPLLSVRIEYAGRRGEKLSLEEAAELAARIFEGKILKEGK